MPNLNFDLKQKPDDGTLVENIVLYFENMRDCTKSSINGLCITVSYYTIRAFLSLHNK